MTSRLVWVALPGGRTPGGGGLLRVLAIPMLDGDRTLAQEGLAEWPPAVLGSGHVQVTVAPAPDATPEVREDLTPRLTPVPGLWSRFFGGIDVVPPGGPVSRSVDVDPTTEHADMVVSTYRDAARSLTSEEARPVFTESVRTRIQPIADVARSRSRPTPPTPVDEDATRRPVDFHLATSVLREHPAVLRALGLLLEVEVPQARFAQMSPRTLVRVTWDAAPDSLPPIESPWTALLRDRFLAQPRTGSDLHASGGMVALGRRVAGRPTWRLHTVDVDQALGGLQDAAEAITPALPALRTAGVLLARVGRLADLEDRGSRATPRTTADTPVQVLHADDLALGYRVDVKVVGQGWHPLCSRMATYAVDGTTFLQDLEEEGHVKVGGGVDHGDQVLRTDEVVARWDGWSLGAPRPALRTPPPHTPSRDLPFHLRTDLRVPPGTLLRLRFGTDYQMRARVADLAGGGPVLADPSQDECDTDLLRFRRHEPLLPPDVRVPAGAGVFGPSGGAFTLVTRGAEGIPDAPSDTVRDLVPPTASFEVIERHGGFDLDDATDPGHARSRELLARTDLPDPAAGGVVGFIAGAPGEPPHEFETKDWSTNWPDLGTKQLVLRARQGDQPTLNWDTDQLLVVRLSPAEEATLEISSLIDERATKAFSISSWLSGEDGAAGSVSAAEDLLAGGRHPMATPAQRVTVRHAVRRPMGTATGTPRVARAAGATFVELSAPPHSEAGADPLLGLHPHSTVAVDVRASWRPREDPADTGADRKPVTQVPMARADTALSTFRHELGDTKHRLVTYELTAQSRYRQFFEAGPDEAFRTVGSLTEVSIPSSARPVPPVVLAAVPAFVWQEERPPGGPILRRRLGNRVRVELAEPWFTTGDGERLAVLVGQPDNASVPVTEAGRDPLWSTGPQPRFPQVTGTPVRVPLAEGGTAEVVDHGTFHAGGSWFADVAFAPSASYGALVQLAVTRHQPASLAGLEMSTIVQTDFVPLLPDRELTVTRQPGRAVVHLGGVAPSGPRPNEVVAILERRVTGTPADDAAVTVGHQAVWELVSFRAGGVGSDLLLDVPDGATGLRVRVREVESIGIDPQPAPGSLGELDERVVFTDTVEL